MTLEIQAVQGLLHLASGWSWQSSTWHWRRKAHWDRAGFVADKHSVDIAGQLKAIGRCLQLGAEYYVGDRLGHSAALGELVDQLPLAPGLLVAIGSAGDLREFLGRRRFIRNHSENQVDFIYKRRGDGIQ